jgi:lipoyl(octanoyl) transferase
MHGFALNVTPESLPPFGAITPCGIEGVSMTCLHDETSDKPSVTEVGSRLTTHLAQLLGYTVDATVLS